MSVIVWCSFFAVSLLGFQIFLISVRMLLREKIVIHFTGKSFAGDFAKGMITLVAALSLDQALKTSAALYKDNKISLRVFLVLLAFSTVSLVVPIFLISALLMNFSGAYLGAIGLFLWIVSRFVPSIEKRSLIFIGWSVFAIGFDLILKQSSLLMSAAPEQPWIYWLGDSSFGSCLFLLFAAGLIVFLVRLPYITVLASIALLLTGIISLPSALSFVFGEILFWFIWSAYREMPESERRSTLIRAGLFAIVPILFMFLHSFFMVFMDSYFGQEYSLLLRYAQFFVGLGIVLLIELAISAGFFHYFSLNRVRQAK